MIMPGDTMKRSLCLLIGKDPLPNRINYLPLTNTYDDPRRLDALIMRNFANSDEVREYFKEPIADFLKKNENFICKCKNHYRGSIVIIEESFSAPPRKVSVLYSDTRKKLEEMLADTVFMHRLAEDDENSNAKRLKLFSEYLIDSILTRNGQNYSKQELKGMLYVWKEELKKQVYGTDKLRVAFKKYAEYKKEVKEELDKRQKFKN